MIRKAAFVTVVAGPVALIGIFTLQYQLPIGPVVLGLGLIPIAGLFVAKRAITRAVPDMVFGAIDTGLLVIPALWGGIVFGVAGAIAGGVIGDALTDAIGGFFEGGIAEWLREKGIEESREAVTTALGKMSGCLLGAGVVLSIALLVGITPGSG
ncbi:MAG: hypothetical protein ACE5LB_08600 [Acidiferrobacterales bacterium]